MGFHLRMRQVISHLTATNKSLVFLCPTCNLNKEHGVTLLWISVKWAWGEHSSTFFCIPFCFVQLPSPFLDTTQAMIALFQLSNYTPNVGTFLADGGWGGGGVPHRAAQEGCQGGEDPGELPPRLQEVHPGRFTAVPPPPISIAVWPYSHSTTIRVPWVEIIYPPWQPNFQRLFEGQQREHGNTNGW